MDSLPSAWHPWGRKAAADARSERVPGLNHSGTARSIRRPAPPNRQKFFVSFFQKKKALLFEKEADRNG
jgi:hypothetical protein